VDLVEAGFDTDIDSRERVAKECSDTIKKLMRHQRCGFGAARQLEQADFRAWDTPPAGVKLKGHST
jgi:hypothetical protein